MIESLKHMEAFEYYYSLGESRNYISVANHYNVSLTSVGKWGSLFSWQDRVAKRDLANAKRLQEATDNAIMEDRKNYRGLVRASIATYAKELKAGNIKITKVEELLKLMDMDLRLMGDIDKKDEAVINNVANLNANEKDAEKQLWQSLANLENEANGVTEVDEVNEDNIDDEVGDNDGELE